MFKIPFFLILFLSFLSHFSQAEETSQSLDCGGLFSGLIKNEPVLKDELGELKTSCENESAAQDRKFWSCVQTRMHGGDLSFDRFIVSTNICNSLT